MLLKLKVSEYGEELVGGKEMGDDEKKKEVWCVVSDTREEQICFF